MLLKHLIGVNHTPEVKPQTSKKGVENTVKTVKEVIKPLENSKSEKAEVEKIILKEMIVEGEYTLHMYRFFPSSKEMTKGRNYITFPTVEMIFGREVPKIGSVVYVGKQELKHFCK